MGDILAMIGALVFALVVGWFGGGRSYRANEKLNRERNKRLRMESEREAESQDDQSLIDRITRGRGS